MKWSMETMRNNMSAKPQKREIFKKVQKCSFSVFDLLCIGVINAAE
jgi:hypothetical protein